VAAAKKVKDTAYQRKCGLRWLRALCWLWLSWKAVKQVLRCPTGSAQFLARVAANRAAFSCHRCRSRCQRWLCTKPVNNVKHLPSPPARVTTSLAASLCSLLVVHAVANVCTHRIAREGQPLAARWRLCFKSADTRVQNTQDGREGHTSE
jgi:hypothetical protein